MEWIIYLVKVILVQGVFTALYFLLLRKETTFIANRFYLLGTVVWSMLFPLLHFKLPKTIQNTVVDNLLPQVVLSSNEVTSVIQSFSSEVLLIWVYIFIAVVMMGLFIKKLMKLYRLIRIGTRKPINGAVLIENTQTNTVFTFLHFIFINSQRYQLDYKTFLRHELVHVRERHTWDLLFMEMLKVIFWINPFNFIYQKELAQIHEYIADEDSFQKIGKKQYVNTLLNEFFDTQHISFINQFYQKSLIKNRIIMITKTKSRQINQLKYAIVFPIILITLWIQNPVTAQVNETVNTKEQTESVPFSVIDEIPIFPGCEGMTQEENKVCFSQKVQEHVGKNFNMSLAKTLNLSAGKKRLYVMFNITEKGKVKDIKARAPHLELEKEAIRVIRLLPKMKPGKQKGKAVKVKYSLPIMFIVDPVVPKQKD
jgi:beta-lactamase regulating signal transducer with metallopeptidase domain